MEEIPDGMPANADQSDGHAKAWLLAQQLALKDRGVFMNQHDRIQRGVEFRQTAVFALKVAAVVVGLLVLMAGWRVLIH